MTSSVNHLLLVYFIQYPLGTRKEQTEQGRITLREPAHGTGQSKEEGHGGLAEGDRGHGSIISVRLNKIRQRVQCLHLIGNNCLTITRTAHRNVTENSVQAEGELLGGRKT